jgi:hypothetical protein
LGTCNISLYISQLIRDSKTCCSYYDFLYKRLLLTRKLLNQGFLMVKLKASFRKFYGRRYDLRNIYFYKSPWICFVCHNPNPALSSLMTNHRVYNKGNTTSQLWSRNCPTLPEHLNTSQFLVGFVLVMQSLVFFCVVCCRSLFVFLSFVLTCTSIFTVSDYISPLASPNNSYCGFTTQMFYQTCLEIRHRIYMLFIYAWDEWLQMFAEIKVLKTYNPLDYLDETNIVYINRNCRVIWS